MKKEYLLQELEELDIVELGRGQIISKEEMNTCPGDYPVYSSSALNNGEFGKYGKFMFDDERITWSIDGGGRLFFRESHKYSVTNVCGWMKVKNKSVLLTKYLYYSLYFQWMLKTFDYTYKAHPSVIIKLYKVKLIPIDEQEKIIKKISEIEDIISKNKLLLPNFDNLIKSRFIELFGDLERNSKNWGIKSFSEFAVIDTNMTNDFVTYADYPHIGIDSIEKNTGVLSGYRTIKEDNVISGKYLFTPEHIIYSKIRPNLNKVALPDFYGLCSADAYPILARENCNRIFLAVLMRSDFFLKHVLSLCGRANQPKVNKEQVQAFKSPLPPIELQNEFAEFFKLIDKSKFSVQKEIDLYQELLDKKMNEYFG